MLVFQYIKISVANLVKTGIFRFWAELTSQRSHYRIPCNYRDQKSLWDLETIRYDAENVNRYWNFMIDRWLETSPASIAAMGVSTIHRQPFAQIL